MCPLAKQVVEAQFCGLTFFARSHPGELCGSNGLPLTPNSITIYGNAQFLKTIQHPHLCSYLTVIRGKHERTVVVSEYYPDSLREKSFNVQQVTRMGFQIVSALDHLNSFGIVYRNLSPENVLFDVHENVQLFNYGLYFMTNKGANVSFPIGHPKYTAPEVFLAGRNSHSGSKADVWSLGIIMAEIALGKCFWADMRIGQVMRKAVSLIHCNGTVLERLAREHGCWERCQELPDAFRDLVETCLRINPRHRPTPRQLLDHPSFSGFDVTKSPPVIEAPTLGLPELYYLWRLAGGDVQGELRRQGLVRSKAPILSLPSLILLEGNAWGQARDSTLMLDCRVVSIPLDILNQRLAHIPLTSYYPLLETTSAIIKQSDQLDDSTLPLIIRERDTEYQFHRIVLFQRLLQGYPYKRDALLEQARRDIPPLYRGAIWAALLNVKGDIDFRYASIDKDTPTHTDRQIEVDIPRCHQYDELLSSSEGHRKFKRVLKAWVVSHPEYVYWQGLDSLCAPFLYLHFNDEARAYACLTAFVPKYLHKFFLKDNSAVIQEYLTKFSQLIGYHDPQLANHLHDIGFVPELFAIPWFLTMFSHVFPLHKILHLWDKLLLGSSAYPLFAGLAILRQLRDTLLASGFNECILLFSDLPEIDMEHCVTYSCDLYEKTPLSITYRQHALHVPTGSPVTPRRHTLAATKLEASDLDLSPIVQSELQAERCPRISANDLIYLLDNDREQTVVVDVRLADEYNRGTIAGSFNIPLSESVDADAPIRAHRGHTIIVIGSKGLSSAQFAEYLLRSGYPRVASLHRGIQVLRNTNLLQIPDSM